MTSHWNGVCLSIGGSVVEQLKRTASELLSRQNAFFSHLCGESVTNGEAVKAHAVAVVVLTLIGIGWG